MPPIAAGAIVTHFTDDERAVLRLALEQVVVQSPTGQLGILHGMDPFVSTHQSLTKAQRQHLDSAARKLGLSGIAVIAK